MEDNKTVSKWVEEARKVEVKTEAFRKSWNHQKPCKEWKAYKKTYGTGHCKHFLEARHRKFKTEIDELFALLPEEITAKIDKKTTEILGKPEGEIKKVEPEVVNL